MRTYRVDRMKDVRFTGEPREGAEAFAAIDLKSYTKRVFSMFGGKQERVVIRFINPLLDAVVDRFGNDKGSVWYEKLDDTHFTVSTQVEISDQFFGWVLGFGKKAKILEPPAVVDQFAAYLDKVVEILMVIADCDIRHTFCRFRRYERRKNLFKCLSAVLVHRDLFSHKIDRIPSAKFAN